jgi:hypothetical protein
LIGVTDVKIVILNETASVKQELEAAFLVGFAWKRLL